MDSEQPRIAVVDDEAPVRKALQRLLRSFGMEVEAFPSGVEFLETVSTAKANCVVLDLHMPKLSGFEVLAQLEASDANIPVIVITGHDTPETEARVMRGGAAAYLLKPVDERTLLDAINAAIAGRRKQ